MDIGAVGDVRELGITESFKLKRQVLLSATEAAEMILRVDDIIRAAPRYLNLIIESDLPLTFETQQTRKNVKQPWLHVYNSSKIINFVQVCIDHIFGAFTPKMIKLTYLKLVLSAQVKMRCSFRPMLF
jgi:hypothetical protein